MPRSECAVRLECRKHSTTQMVLYPWFDETTPLGTTTQNMGAESSGRGPGISRTNDAKYYTDCTVLTCCWLLGPLGGSSTICQLLSGTRTGCRTVSI